MNIFAPETLAAIAKIASLAWWSYVIGILSLFLGGLLLNYIIKKINETRLANRFESLRNKATTNQWTQVQRPVDIDNRPTAPSGIIADNLTKGIPIIFNKEENLLEDKRKKDDHPKTNNKICVVGLAMNSIENIVEDSPSVHSNKDVEMNKSAFLGTIYKDLYEKRAAIDKSKSLSNTDRDSILNEIVDKLVWKINESKSTPNVRKLIDIQTENDLKNWAFDLIKKQDEASASASTSGRC